MQAIFKGKSDDAIRLLKEVKQSKNKWKHCFEHDLLMAFWLAVHKEDVEVVRSLIDFEPCLRSIMALAFKRKMEKKPGLKITKKDRKKFKGYGKNYKELTGVSLVNAMKQAMIPLQFANSSAPQPGKSN